MVENRGQSTTSLLVYILKVESHLLPLYVSSRDGGKGAESWETRPVLDCFLAMLPNEACSTPTWKKRRNRKHTHTRGGREAGQDGHPPYFLLLLQFACISPALLVDLPSLEMNVIVLFSILLCSHSPPEQKMALGHPTATSHPMKTLPFFSNKEDWLGEKILVVYCWIYILPL